MSISVYRISLLTKKNEMSAIHMELGNVYIIKDLKGNEWSISSYSDLYKVLDSEVFSDLSKKGRDIIRKNLLDSDSVMYIKRYLENKQVYQLKSDYIDVEKIINMLKNSRLTQVANKVGVGASTLSKIIRGAENLNPDKRDIQITELRNIRMSTLVKLANYYHEYYIPKLNKGYAINESDMHLKKITVGKVYSCQNCGMDIIGGRYCPNCGVEIEY